MNEATPDLPTFGPRAFGAKTHHGLPLPPEADNRGKDTVPIVHGRTPAEIDLDQEEANRADQDLLNALIQLVSELEQGRVQLAALDRRHEPGQVVHTLAWMVRAAADVARALLDPEAAGLPLAKALRQADDWGRAADACEQQLTPSLGQRLARLFGKPADRSGKRRKQVRQLGERALGVLESLFDQFAAGFTATGAAEWRQTAGPFLTELKRVVNPI